MHKDYASDPLPHLKISGVVGGPFVGTTRRWYIIEKAWDYSQETCTLTPVLSNQLSELGKVTQPRLIPSEIEGLDDTSGSPN